jgi:carboxyl-terminal processing protease
MKPLLLTFFILLNLLNTNAQQPQLDKAKIKEDLNQLLTDLTQSYIYLQEKKVDLNCIRNHYTAQVDSIKTEEEVVLLFEYLLDEFYDSHLMLNTNRKSSFRLYAPLYVKLQNNRAIISDVWQTGIENLDQDILSAEITHINGTDFPKALDSFPTHCHNKKDPKVREWIANKLLAGRYNSSRMLTLKFASQRTIHFNMDSIRYKAATKLLTFEKRNGIGIIRINNSLGNNKLIEEFDTTLDSLMDTKALIIDLRNTVDGGNSYVARAIMGRFISTPKPYQKHWRTEKYDSSPGVERSWVEYVSPRGVQYKKPVIILVGRWTGSMGEGLAIGFEGMGRGRVVGTEMERLAGEMSGFSFKHQKFGYRLSTAKLFHVNGTLRENYVPGYYVKQTTIKGDEILERALQLIGK